MSDNAISMDVVNLMKKRIRSLYEEHSRIHVNMKTERSKLQQKNIPATIVEVYRNIFVISENSSGTEKRHTFSYTDALTGNIEIAELNQFK